MFFVSWLSQLFEKAPKNPAPHTGTPTTTAGTLSDPKIHDILKKSKLCHLTTKSKSGKSLMSLMTMSCLVDSDLVVMTVRRKTPRFENLSYAADCNIDVQIIIEAFPNLDTGLHEYHNSKWRLILTGHPSIVTDEKDMNLYRTLHTESNGQGYGQFINNDNMSVVVFRIIAAQLDISSTC